MRAFDSPCAQDCAVSIRAHVCKRISMACAI